MRPEYQVDPGAQPGEREKGDRSILAPAHPLLPVATFVVKRFYGKVPFSIILILKLELIAIQGYTVVYNAYYSVFHRPPDFLIKHKHE